MRNRIEGIIVCKDYSDFLAHTLPENIEHFDHLVVVTHYSDKKTQEICSKYSVECVQAHVFDEDGDRFNKGRAVNVGLSHLKNPDWIIHFDADIVFPKRFRWMIEHSKLDTANIYGCDRVNIFGWEKWLEVKDKMNPYYKDHWFVSPPEGHPLGSRIIHREHGYVPIGFFQMWHKSQNKKYAIFEGTAEHSDVLFAIQWHRKQRILLPEIIVYHLESREKQGKMGENWNGRKSKGFCPCHPHHHQHIPYCPKPKEKK